MNSDVESAPIVGRGDYSISSRTGKNFSIDRIMKKIPKFHEAKPLDPDKFSTAFAYASMAYGGQAEVLDPRELKFRIEDTRGRLQTYSFSNIPLNKAMSALKERYSDDSDEFFSAAFRFFALIELVRDGHLKNWTKQDPDDSSASLVHDAVLDVAAVLPLNKSGKFSPKKFIRKLEKLASDKYPDVDESG